MLSDAQIQQNFKAGVGKRLLMRFDTGQWLGSGSFVEFTVTEWDDYSYLFCTPTLVSSGQGGSRVGVDGPVDAERRLCCVAVCPVRAELDGVAACELGE